MMSVHAQQRSRSTGADPDVATEAVIRIGDAGGLLVDRPVTIELLDGPIRSFGYSSVRQLEDAWCARADLELEDGTSVSVTDRYEQVDDVRTSVTRTAVIHRAGAGGGIRFGIEATTTVAPKSHARWQFYIPCTLYNRNDLDGDGREDFLGTYVQDHRDDKNGALAMLAWDPVSATAFALARLDVPQSDPVVGAEQLRARRFLHPTDVGSLGMFPRQHEVGFRASWPFSEEYSYCLDTDRSGWAAFAPLVDGTTIEVVYAFDVWSATDLTDAIWALFTRQKAALGSEPRRLPFTPDEVLEQRQLLTQLYYRRWSVEENPREPAGYLVHFSPRSGVTNGNLIEFGFSGDQTLLAYTQMEWGLRHDVPLYMQRAASVIDFFVRHCQDATGFCEGIYDPVADEFTHWFTGILMPFQYTSDAEEARRYVGRQIASALAPIAQELRGLDGNYLRTMCEAILPVLLAVELAPERSREWLGAGVRFGEFLLRTQAADGSWYRAYAPEGTGLTSPAAWFGASYLELKSGTIFPAPILCKLTELTGDPRFLEAAVRAADFVVETYVEPVSYTGGLNDTTHLKSVKPDAVGVMFALRSLLRVYEATGEGRFLDAAIKAGRVLCSWVYLWDVPMDPSTLLGANKFRSTGWAGCDVIASGTYLDDELLEFVGTLAHVAVLAHDRDMLDVAEIVHHGMQHGVSMPGRSLGYVAPGIQCEGVLTSYWLSAPDETLFSGAVNKVKGDDNDTCNALTNGQAALGAYELERVFGTRDFDEIRRAHFA